MSKLSICTIVSKNYLPYARVLAESFLKHNDGEVFVLLVDNVDGYFDPAAEKFKLVEIEELRYLIPDFEKFCFQYTIYELNAAVKPFFLEYLFEKYRVEKLAYLDPDIYVMERFEELSKLLDNNSLVITPYLTAPIEDERTPSEIEILQSGVYNLGFIGLRWGSTVQSHLKWWQKRLRDRCVVAPEKGLFVDQKWIDLVPGFYEDVHILREPGYNVAYWNYHCRTLEKQGGRYLINGKPAFFFHFSGFDPYALALVSKHQNRFRLEDVPNLRGLFEEYREKVLASGWEKTKSWPYFFDRFDNGIKIPPFIRKFYLKTEKHFKGSPFSTAEGSLYQWLNQPADARKPVITNLLFELSKVCGGLLPSFNDVLGDSRQRFVIWALSAGRKDFNIDDRFFEKVIENTSLDGRSRCKAAAGRSLYEIAKKGGDILLPFAKRNQRLISSFQKLHSGVNSFLAAQGNKRFLNISNIEGPPELKVNLAGYITSESGLGEAARANIRAIEKAGIPYALNNLKSLSRQAEDRYGDFVDENPHGINIIQVNADQVSAFYNDKGPSYFKNKYNIGFWYWELSKFPDEWLDRFQYFNEIWVASSFCQEALAAVAPIPVVKIPPSICMDEIQDASRARFGLPEDEFIFLFIFDLLSFFERKNPLAVIRAFKEAFNPGEKARLVLKCSNMEWNTPARDRILEETKGLRVTFIDKYLKKGEVHALMDASDSYISLHRSEGFGLPMAEMMSLGKPVIATGYSSNTDFMNVNNSFLVKYDFMKLKEDIGPYKKGCVWADPDLFHAAELMRKLYEDREGALKVGNRAREHIRENLSPEATGRMLRQRLEHIVREHVIYKGKFI